MHDKFDYQKDQIELHKNISCYYGERYRYKFSQLFQEFWNNEILDICPKSDSPILDFGCGTGILFSDSSKKFKSVIGLDISFEMIRKADRNIPQIKGCIAGDGCHLPFSNDTFELVVCRSALHHLPGLNKSFLEIKRILKDNGIFVFSEPSNDNYFIRFARFIMYKFSSRFDERDMAFEKNKLSRQLTDLGFKVKKVERFGYLAYFFCGFPDHFPLFRFIPFSCQITRLLIRIDRFFSKIPLIKDQSFHVIFKISK